MALQDKKIMPPLWLACREIERYSIGWRMGYGERITDIDLAIGWIPSHRRNRRNTAPCFRSP